MDTQMEDKIYHQIERSLSNNNINQDLFTKSMRGASDNDALIPSRNSEMMNSLNNHDSDNYISNTPALTRAEYIRQAREACLRQLNTMPVNNTYEHFMNVETPTLEETSKSAYTENTQQELASFRALIIRTVCALVIFSAIFIIDYFKIKLGGISFQDVREYVIGKDYLKQLENIIMTWIR